MKHASRAPSREEAKLLTRHRLMQATLQLLVTQGREYLTTGRIAHQAGVAQATFYVHFRDLDDLLAALVRDIVDHLQPALTRIRLHLDEEAEFPAMVRHSYRISLEAIVAHADLLKLFMAEYYRKSSALGACAQALFTELVVRLYQDLRPLTLSARMTDAQLMLMAEMLVGLTLQAGMNLADHPERGVESVIDMLYAVSMGLLQA